ncbi:MAG: hypothetical protein AAF541_04755 [Pseudomonadota bacterium]
MLLQHPLKEWIVNWVTRGLIGFEEIARRRQLRRMRMWQLVAEQEQGRQGCKSQATSLE